MPCTQATQSLPPRTIHQIYNGSGLSCGYKYCWIDIVADYLFQVLVYPISIDVHKGGIQDCITISRPHSCKDRMQNRIYNTAKI